LHERVKTYREARKGALGLYMAKRASKAQNYQNNIFFKKVKAKTGMRKHVVTPLKLP
jgi:hypothetical protein